MFLRLLWIWLIGASYALFQEINTDDETWFFQVVSRFLSGEVLYKEIFLGVGPLSVYCAALPMLIFGKELLIARLVLVSYFTLGVFFTILILNELKLERYNTLLLLLTCFVLAHPQTNWGFSGYNPLAKVLFLATFWATLKWRRSFEKKWLISACCFAALCFTAKQNVGAIAALCVCLQLLLAKEKREIPFFVALFLGVVTLVFLPIFIQGGFSAFLDYGIFNKTRYIALKEVSYFLKFTDWSLYSICIYSAPFLLLLGGSLAVWKKGREKPVLFTFLLGSILTLFPRPDNLQKIVFVPCALIAILYFYSHFEAQILPRIKFAAKWSLLLLFSSVLFLSFKGFYHRWIQEEIVFSTLPQFRWIAIETPCHAHWHRMQREFFFPEKDLFFLSTHAGFYYLLFNRHNPTPFDVPFHPALGCRGEEEIIDLLDNEAFVALDHLSWSNWPALYPAKHPIQLEAFIQTSMESTTVQPGFETIFSIYKKRRS